MGLLTAALVQGQPTPVALAICGVRAQVLSPSRAGLAAQSPQAGGRRSSLGLWHGAQTCAVAHNLTAHLDRCGATQDVACMKRSA